MFKIETFFINESFFIARANTILTYTFTDLINLKNYKS